MFFLSLLQIRLFPLTYLKGRWLHILISSQLLIPSSEFLSSNIVFFSYEISSGFLNIISAEVSYPLINCKCFSFTSLSIAITVALKCLSNNLGLLSVGLCWLSFSLRMSHIFLILRVSGNFGWYSRHCEHSFIKTLDAVINLHTVLL